MVDGWIEVPVIHEPIVRTRFEKKKKNLSGWEGQRVRVELQRPNISGIPLASSLSLSIGFHNIRGLA
ncbi:hypothetical protein K443DRAFT_413889 [Laccaria amethystina LaAM-08-1]|uniref:Uncharacterized protein n=1 Tax=Laccaria amethystina LaAM-08-1 TaxID=1095629 RepID=A0A0C9WPV5_9AGAR|nr:hypothetical protein K443DRAFT_413889 [Laccaria amethystina LaAM-08-1]